MGTWYKNVKALGLNAVANSFRVVLEVLQPHVAGKGELSMSTFSVIMGTFLVLDIWLGH